MKKILLYSLLIVFSFLICFTAFASEPEVIWLENPGEEFTIITADPNGYGDGLYLIEVRKGDKIYTAHSPEGGGHYYYGYVNQQGEWVVTPIYNSATPFIHGYAEVWSTIPQKINGLVHYRNEKQFINKQGESVSEIELDYTKKEDAISELTAGQQNGKWGFSDKSGNVIVPYLYDEVKPFSEGVAAVRIGNLWGCINKQGTEVLPCKYDAVGQCKENRIAVKWQNRYGYYNASGEKVIDFLYGAVTDFCNGYATVSSGDFSGCTWDSYWRTGCGISQSYNNNTFGLINLWGDNIISEDYIYISNVQDGTAICQRADDKSVGIINLSLMQYEPPQRNFIRLFWDMKQLSTDQSPIIENGRTLVPMQAISTVLGAEAIWNKEKSTVTVQKENIIIVFPIDSFLITVNNSQSQIDVPARIVNNQAMLPIRYLSEFFDLTVDWDEKSYSIFIY